jgi:ABC-type glutathione transport system ATPase component
MRTPPAGLHRSGSAARVGLGRRSASLPLPGCLVTAALLRLNGVTRRYPKRALPACDAVSLDVKRGEFVSLVGESGSGKSTLSRLILGLEQPDRGRVEFDGVDLASLSGAALRRMHRRIGAVFQDPLASLNPRWTAAHSIAHPLAIHGLCGWANKGEAVRAMLDRTSLPGLGQRFPHELSGGQRQRVCLARALVTRPELVIADEALSGLDVTTQASVLDMLETIRTEYGTAFLFISHDLRTVRRVSDRVAVMQQGKLVECADTETLFSEPTHSYTKALLASLLGPRFRPPSIRL